MSVRDDRDLDPGIYAPSKPAGPASPRRRPAVLLTDGGLDAPSTRPVVAHFDAAGRPTEDPSAAVARDEVAGGVARCYVKVARKGPLSGRFYDPRGIYTTNDLARPGVYEFREVPESAFLDYVHYLRHHDGTFLRRAESSVLDR